MNEPETNPAYTEEIRVVRSAIRDSNTETLRRYLESGHDVDSPLPGKLASIGAESLLSLAISAGQPDVVRLLIEHGADVNQKRTGILQQAPVYSVFAGSAF